MLAEDARRSLSTAITRLRVSSNHAVLPRSDSGLEGKPADWVGIEAILYTEQRLDEVRLGDGSRASGRRGFSISRTIGR